MTALATIGTPVSHPTCTVVRPGEGRAYWAVQELFTPLITGEQTGGAYMAATVIAQPNGGPPPHLHQREDELFYVAYGTFEFIFDRERFVAGAGTAIFIPRGVVHTYNNVGDKPGKLIVVTTPSGFEDFIDDAGQICSDGSDTLPQITPRTFQKLELAARKHGIELKPDWTSSAVLRNAKSRELWVIGLHVKILLTGEQTNGTFSVAELTPSPGDFVPAHSHKAEDEMFYALEGTVWFELGGDSITATPGTFVHIPRGVVHGFRNIGSRPAKMLNFHTPGGFDRFFEASGTECLDQKMGPPKTVPNFARFAIICRDHGMELAE